MDERIKAVVFDEERHRYFYNGKRLNGVTGAIGKIVGKTFPDTDIVKLATVYGSDVHKEVENYYNTGSNILSSEGSKWVIEELERFGKGLIDDCVECIQCEVMVSDFEGTASKVDVVVHTTRGSYLFDIKTTSHFDREYCSLQLSCYKDMYEKNYNEKVLDMFVLSTKAKRRFHILEKEKSKIEKVFSLNREGT